MKKINADALINNAIYIMSFIPLFSSKIAEITVFKQRKYVHSALNEFL